MFSHSCFRELRSEVRRGNTNRASKRAKAEGNVDVDLRSESTKLGQKKILIFQVGRSVLLKVLGQIKN